jgi:hypothetical protein
VPRSLLAVLGILEHHYVIIAISVAVLLVLAAIILGIRKGRVFGRHHPRPSIPTRPATTREEAQALLREWTSDKAPLSSPLRLLQRSAGATAASPTAGKEVPVEPTEIDHLLKLGDLFERNLLTRQEFEEKKRRLFEYDSARTARSSRTSRSPKVDAGSSRGEPGQE